LINLISIRVECHSGYKADEYPKCFYCGDEKFGIEEITDRWYQGDSNPEWPASNYFKVRLADGRQVIIKHDMESDRWYLCK
jgi:hypothetical protein